jgi:hypothetical protein
MSFAIPISDEFLDDLAERLEERLRERRRWGPIALVVEYTGLTVGQVRGLKRKHPEIATRVGKSDVYDLRKVDEALERDRLPTE